METITVEGIKRTELGKRSSSQLRKAGDVPCVIYGGKENFHFSTESINLRDLIYTSAFNIAEIKIDGNSVKAIIKDIQFDPITDSIMHVDFVELIEGQLFKAKIPVKLTGLAAGVREGGRLMQKIRKVDIQTVPEKMVGAIEVNVDSLELGKSIRVRDIEAPEGIEVLNSPGSPLASVEIPRALRSAQSAAEGGEEEEVSTEE